MSKLKNSLIAIFGWMALIGSITPAEEMCQ